MDVYGRKQIKIIFKPPTYSSDKYPSFPQEVIDLIFEFLRYEPVTLPQCSLVCHALYHAARRVSWGPRLELSTRAALSDCGRMLMSNRTTSYGKRFGALLIDDNSKAPFAHVWPMLIPAPLLPRVSWLCLSYIDWRNSTPHCLFFDLLSCYTTVKSLRIGFCNFRSASDVRRLIDALPNLEELQLLWVMLERPLTRHPVSYSVTPAAIRRTLREITVSCDSEDWPPHYPGHENVVIPSPLDVCTAYTSVISLDIHLVYFSSVPHLGRFLSRFPSLSRLTMHAEFGTGGRLAPEDVTATQPAHILAPPPLTKLELADVPSMCASQLLKLLWAPSTWLELEHLEIELRDTMLPELLWQIMDILHLSGARLSHFGYNIPHDGDLILLPRLAAAISLEDISMTLRCILPSPLRICWLFSTLLNITSPCLRTLTITIELADSNLLQDVIHILVRETDTAESASAFYAILSRSVYDRLSTDSVSIFIRHSSWPYDPVPADIDIMSAIKPHILALFAPWLERRVLLLKFDGRD